MSSTSSPDSDRSADDAPPSAPPAHPSAYALEAASFGEADDGAVQAHLVACAACRAHVDDLRAAASAYRARTDADAFVTRLVAEDTRGRGDAPARRPPALRLLRLATWAAPLAVAAAALVFVARPQAPVDVVPGGSDPGAGGTSGPVRFKGGEVALAVVRERDGRQERLATGFGIRAGDALRLQVTVAARAPVAAGVLDDDGTWIPLLPATELDPGPRFVDDAVRVDDHPSGGTFVAGTPEAVETARRTRRFDDVTTLRFQPEAR